MRNRREYKPVITAAIIASIMVFVFGIAYRVLAFQLGAPVRSYTPIDQSILETFPLEIGDWSGQDVPVDEAIMRKTGTDIYINRRYSRKGGLESVDLYLASGVRARTVVGHRPEICYIAAGWNLKHQRSLTVPLSEELNIKCSLFEFSRGSLNTEYMIVLHYLIVDGQYYGDIETLQLKAGRRLGMVNYAALVQISSTESLYNNMTTQIISDFAADSGPYIVRLFKDIEGQMQSFQ